MPASSNPQMVGVQDACILFHHGNAWNGVPARQRYLMEAMSQHVPVIYLEDAEDRKWRVTYESPMPNVTVVRGLVPMLLRFRNREWNLPIHAACRWHLRWLREQFRRVVIWDAENWLRPYRFIPHDILVFDCIDPCFSDDPQVLADYERRETEVVKAADVVFASADALVDECRRHRPDVTLLNNACEPREYADDLIAAAFRPDWWPETDKPIAAYLGTLDARFDFQIVYETCTRSPHVHFVLAGLILAEHREHVARLQRLPNVTCPGRVSVEDGRYLLSRCSVGLIPFTRGRMNDSINPVKMYAYALLGKPVVGTAIRELRDRPEVAQVANTGDEMAARIDVALQMGGQEGVARALRQFALNNTWADRARAAWDVLKERLDVLRAGHSFPPARVPA